MTAFGFPAGITVTVQRQTEDKWGNFTTTVEFPIGPCGIDYTSSTEQTEQRDTVTRLATLYTPPGSDIRAPDRVLLPDGSRWSVVGHPADFTQPLTGWNPGMTVTLQKVDG
ncbi:MAG: hypothetical protein JWO67_6954 [Streptosporangiaceae bacterium]|nr:hypothetical protein [Streptosporangiaceae bacterium]